MDKMLGHPSVDPHGDPIPDERGVVVEIDLQSLLVCPAGTKLRVARVLDQTPDFLGLLERQGLRPGVEVLVATRDDAADTVELELGEGRRFSLGQRAASKILVGAEAPGLAD